MKFKLNRVKRSNLQVLFRFLKYIVAYTLAIPDMYSDMPIGMSADTCIQYWEDL